MAGNKWLLIGQSQMWHLYSNEPLAKDHSRWRRWNIVRKRGEKDWLNLYLLGVIRQLPLWTRQLWLEGLTQNQVGQHSTMEWKRTKGSPTITEGLLIVYNFWPFPKEKQFLFKGCGSSVGQPCWVDDPISRSIWRA